MKQDIQKPVMMEAMNKQGRQFVSRSGEAARVQESEPHPLLIALATKHAQYMASVCVQGHQNWNGRFRQIQQELGMIGTEIAAETWPWQHEKNEVAREMFKSWSQTSHWNVVKVKHKFWGGDIAQGRNGIWYGCIIVAD